METTKSAPSENRVQPGVKAVKVVVADSAPATNSPRVTAALVVLVLLGGGLRTAAFLADRCLWIDEAMLALNLVDRTPRQLFDKLDYNQGAPVGFLLAVKASISAFGPSAWALRLGPFLASLAGLVGFALVARRLLSAPAALLAVALFALSPHVVSYAGECKQYASDAALAVGLFAVALGLIEGQGGLWRWLALAVAGAAAVWCSHPAAFVLGGIGTALLALAAHERDRGRLLAAGLTVAAWLVSFAACYFICLKQLDGNKYLTHYWSDHFFALPPKGFGDLVWLADHAIMFFTVPGGFGGARVPLGGLATVLAMIGLREFGRERRLVAVALVVPVALVLFASGMHKYPIGGRLMLFLVPLAVLPVARGAWVVFAALAEKNRLAAFAMIAMLVVAPLWETVAMLRRPPRHEELNPVLEQVRNEYQTGDRVFVYYGARPAFTFYTREHPFPAAAVTFGEEHRDAPAGYRADLAPLRGRVWVIVSHRHGDEETVIRAALDCRGTCEREVQRPGAAANLYLLREPTPPTPLPSGRGE